MANYRVTPAKLIISLACGLFAAAVFWLLRMSFDRPASYYTTTNVVAVLLLIGVPALVYWLWSREQQASA